MGDDFGQRLNNPVEIFFGSPAIGHQTQEA
jgi:hypothetical protein